MLTENVSKGGQKGNLWIRCLKYRFSGRLFKEAFLGTWKPRVPFESHFPRPARNEKAFGEDGDSVIATREAEWSRMGRRGRSSHEPSQLWGRDSACEDLESRLCNHAEKYPRPQSTLDSLRKCTSALPA